MSARSAAHVLTWLVCLLVATSVHAQGPTCSNGVPGVQSEAFEDICCAAGCLQCGGPRCISANRRVGLGAQDCCNGTIRNNGDDCATTGEGPCVIFPPVVANQCLDLTNDANRCSVDEIGLMNLDFCEITDQDVEAGDLAACFDAAGPENISRLFFGGNDLMTLPPTIFDSLTNLALLKLDGNGLVTLPSGIFDSLPVLRELNLRQNDLTTLPPTIFDSLTNLGTLDMSNNGLVTLPSGIFDSLTELINLFMERNDLTTLPPAIFDSLTNLFFMLLNNNALVTLPSGIFDSLTGLRILDLRRNPDLECLPAVLSSVTSLRVDTVGTECGCFLLDGSNPCGENVECSPGATGFTCG